MDMIKYNLKATLARYESQVVENRLAISTATDNYFTSIQPELDAFANLTSDILLYTLSLEELRRDGKTENDEEVVNNTTLLKTAKLHAQEVKAVVYAKQKSYFVDKAVCEEMIEILGQYIKKTKEGLNMFLVRTEK